MSSLRYCQLFALLWGLPSLAIAVSDAPLRALNAYIEQNGNCPEQLVEWNRKYNPKVTSGETPRNFYYRVLGYTNWGDCGRPYLRPIFGELQKVSIIYSRGRVTAAEFEAKEAQLVNLLFAALADRTRGAQMVQQYESKTAARLIGLIPPRQFFDCTFFGDQPRCMD